MSAYFESLQRRAASGAPAHGGPARRPPLSRLAPGAIPPEYAALRERLLATAGNPLRTIVFAGCDGGEGCTQIAREFAEALASMGRRVLLVDADMRTAGLTATLGPRGGDVAQLVASGRDPEDAPWASGSLAVVPSPLGQADKETFLTSPAFAAWVHHQETRYDYVLLDVPPLQRFADGLLVCRVGDGVVLVVQPRHTRLQSVLRAKEQITRAGARLLGFVANRVVDERPPILRRFSNHG